MLMPRLRCTCDTSREVTFQHKWEVELEIKTYTGNFPALGAQDPMELNLGNID